ncbi:MAG: HlyD family efflux transporter periplasmic adaptor subunit [Gammaproteobacteria bacterium]
MSSSARRFRQFVLPLGVLVAGIAIAAWFVASRPRALSQPPQEKVWPVAVVEVARADVQPAISVYGEVRAVREAELRAEVAGRVVSLNPAFKDGNLIVAGTELAVIDPIDYENRLAEQRAERARAEAQLAELRRELTWEQRLEENAARQVELAKRALARLEKLAADGRESRKVRDDAETALAVSEQGHMQRAQTIARLGTRIDEQEAAYAKAQATLANAERELAKTRITAPFTGHATDVRLALGQLLAAGERLGRLLSASELEVRFDLPEDDFARLTAAAGTLIGRPATVVWRLGDDTREFPAVLARTGAEIDPTLGGIALFATLDGDAVERGLRAGAFVEVRLADVVYRDVFRLPPKAIASNGQVYALVDERLAAVEVEIVRDLGDAVLVRGALDPAHPVVARAFAGIGPGLRARPL